MTTTQQDYRALLESKRLRAKPCGVNIHRDELHAVLRDDQRDITAWALRVGRAAIFADTGLGKTLMQLEWARLLGVRTLIIAPLSVAEQTIEQARDLLDMTVRYTSDGDDVEASPLIHITNYENAHKFTASDFGAVVLDESSILKSKDSKTRMALTEQWADTPYRLCCTATPAPNDLAEIVNHADFLGVMSRGEVFATFFINDQDANGGLNVRLKKHSVTPFYRWLSSWAVAIRKPSDLGYSDDGFDLPPLEIREHEIETDWTPDGQLFTVRLGGIQDRAAVRNLTETARVRKAVELVCGEPGTQFIVWHQTNAEGYALMDALGEMDAVLVEGAQSAEEKHMRYKQFIAGERRVLVTKPTIAGMGMNFQHAHRAVVMSINDSYEQFYQLVRRQYRYGQAFPVRVDVIIADAQRDVWDNVRNKAQMANEMMTQLVENISVHQRREVLSGNQSGEDYITADERGESWHLMLGDSCERLAELESESVGLSVHSPPFVNRYAYTATERDLGNSSGLDEFMQHYEWIARELYRVTQPGRNACVHIQQVRLTKRDTGAVQLLDFRSPVIEMFTALGWTYYHEITVDKDAQAQARRKHHVGLMFKSLNTDSSKLGGALADYLLVFKKPGDPEPVHPPNVTERDWITFARPVWYDDVPGRTRAKKLKQMSREQLIQMVQAQTSIWYDIDEIDVLDTQVAKADDDEMHLAPLQLSFIERCIKLWSNPGETVLDPFSGIGSTAYVAMKNGRYGVGIDLKPKYHETAVKNLRRGEVESGQMTLWEMMDVRA